MFPKTRRRIEELESGVKWANRNYRELKNEHYELTLKFKRLEKYLGCNEVRIHTVEYVRKGGPEKG